MCYTIYINTSFYSSGLLVHLETQKILLRKTPDLLWSMFEDLSHDATDGAAVFQQVILTTLNIKVPHKNIFPVYDYFHDTYKKMQYVYYAHVKTMRNFSPDTDNFSWFTFQQATKLPISKQTKQDITVAQRVIDLQHRESTNTQYHSPVSS